MDNLLCQSLLLQALMSPVGIAVTTNDTRRAREKFYEARRTANLPDLDELCFHPSPYDPGGELWICKKSLVIVPEPPPPPEKKTRPSIPEELLFAKPTKEGIQEYLDLDIDVDD